ncbi:hypothetical protein [Cyanothece sp. BG0011]|uniref:hypothetical protein n=1 Tax=Cyanothece sp. BG0011 TaxID=2082950 RepID=UPI000D1D6331|nr:hypothetical protein [Cyanothece sp. BG0011]
MTKIIFADILEAAEQLTPEDQEYLISILQNRLRDRHRGDRIRDVQEAKQEFTEGKCQPVTSEEIIEELLG